MLRQLTFDLYSCVVVGLVGNALIGWELGKKGFINLGLEGARNKRIRFSILAFVAMLVWQKLTGMQSSCFSDVKGLWMPLVGLAAFSVSRALKPRSLLLYDRAKLLHERTYMGDWHHERSTTEIARIRDIDSLKRAEHLYHESLSVQERLAANAQTGVEKNKHLLNVGAVCCQLALLNIQKALPDLAGGWAAKAVAVSEQLSQERGNDREAQQLLSHALFRLGQIDEVAMRYESARSNFHRSLALDTQLGDQPGIEATRVSLERLSHKTTG